MSIINDALKKAQRQRGQDTPQPARPAGQASPAAPVAAAAPVERRARPAGAQTFVYGLVGAVVITALAAAAGIYFFHARTKANPPAVASTNPVQPAPGNLAQVAPPAEAPAPAAQPPAQAIVPAAAPAQPSATGSTAAVATAAPPPSQTETPAPRTPPPAPAPTTAPPAAPVAVVSTPTPPPSVKFPEAPPAEPAAAAPSTAPKTRADRDPRILAYLDSLRVAGIRPAGADSKVLMNDRVYRLNDVVDYPLGLKLTGVEVRQLTFTDERGATYVKDF